jgi:serine/threonine protein kinase
MTLLLRGAASAATRPSARPRLQLGYEILEEIGHGGMGVVFKARQVGLNRIVALKKIQTGADADPEAMARFRREAEAVAKLDHPNIVQVHEVGEQDGQPYLALEYIDGGTLRERLKGPLPPHEAAGLLRALALAVEHAHQRGIVHRDLKPANVLLQKKGGNHKGTEDTERNRTEDNSSGCSVVSVPLWFNDFSPRIADFGVAKDLSRQLGQTQTGAIVGTPEYMAPEQASGLVHQVGPAADMYALGAILYQCLTGRPPFQGATILDTLQQVRQQDPVSPSRLQPKVPRDLETICLKCLQKDPARRYASAGDLAEDLRRFLAGEAVLARPTPPWQRACKWAKRRPAAAALVAFTGLGVAGLVAGVWLHTVRLGAQVERAEAGEARALAQQRRADASYEQARDAIGRMLDRLEKFHAPGVPQVEALRRELRKDAIAYYRGISHLEEDASPARRLDMAKAYLFVGPLEGGDPGLESLEHARRLLEKLLADDPGNVDYRAELGRCFTALGNNAAGRGKQEACQRWRERALAVFQELGSARPNDPALQRRLAACHTNLGCGYEVTNRLPELEHHWQQAVRIMEELTRRHPGEGEDQRQLAIAYTNLGLLYGETKRISDAIDLFGKAAALLGGVVRAHPHQKEWALNLAQTLRLLGAFLKDAGRAEEAREHLTRAIKMMDEMVREDPSRAYLRQLLLGCLRARLDSCTLLRRHDEGEADWRRCLELPIRLNYWNDLCGGALFDARVGEHALAAERADRLVAQPRVRDERLYELAKAYAVAAGAAGKDGRLPLTVREKKAERYAAAGVALLSRLDREGFFQTPERRAMARAGDADLGPLRPRPGFQRLLSGWSAR